MFWVLLLLIESMNGDDVTGGRSCDGNREGYYESERERK